MAGPDTIALIHDARNGDRSAWAELVNRYYNGWLRKFHGRLDHAVRKLYDTQDLVQSAVADAMRDIPTLENEAAFFVWVNAIIRHKIGMRKRRLCRERSLSDSGENSLRGNEETPDALAASLDDYLRCLEAILGLFPKHPESTAAVTLKLIDGLAVKEIAARLDRPERTVYRWLDDGLRLLKENLGS